MSYVMSQLCVKVMVDDGSLSIAVIVHGGLSHYMSCISNYMSLCIVS